MKINFRKTFVISIIIICIIAINLSVYFQLSKKQKNNNIKEENIVIDTSGLAENFKNIFDNKIDYKNNISNINKKDATKELVYSNFIKQDKTENIYELNVNIPYINIENTNAEEINKEINELFYKKVNTILAKSGEYTIYTVKYKAFVNQNILSLIVSANLKEGENPQREIIKTYNYNLSSNSSLDINQILEYRKISQEFAQNKINETIEIASNNANKYKELGYTKYIRDVNDAMYKIENTKVYFLGKDKALYILYPYGNMQYSSEVDLVVM